MVLRNEGGLLGGANGGEGGWRVGDVTVSSAVRKGEPDAAEQQRTSAFNLHAEDVHENTMGLGVGDLNDDGFPVSAAVALGLGLLLPRL